MTPPADHAAIRARVQAATWQPIETAPDGVPVLVRGGWRKDRAEIVEADGSWWRHGGSRSSARPTEWRPLPTDEHDADLTALLAERDEQAAEVERLTKALEGARAAALEPDLFWLNDGEAGFPDWRDAIDGGPESTVVELDTACHTGSRWAVYIPTEGAHSWRDDCHLFETEAEAERALATAAPATGDANG